MSIHLYVWLFLPVSLLMLRGALSKSAASLTPSDSPTPSQKFERKEQLDTNGDFWLFWTPNKTHVTFETHVRTFGYVGFGFSGNGQMYPGDVVVGWVKDGVTYFKDCHTTGHVMPVADTSQDWQLIRGWENEFGTVLKFTRKLDTCDKDDFVITGETIRAIYAYHSDDPASFTSLPWHGQQHRGTKSLLLLAIKPDPVLPSDTRTFDLIKDHYHVPSRDTTYHCTTFRLPPLKQKNHIVKYEPIIQKGNEMHVHHIVIYNVVGHVNSSYDHINYDCTRGMHEPEALTQQQIFLLWAVGGKEYYFPEVTGISIGMPEDPSLFILETHYDNPTQRSDIVDSSGIRFTYTPTLRQYDSGLIYTGWPTNEVQVIPPHESQWISKAYCAQECLQNSLPDEGVNVYAVFQHAHLLARGIVTRHFRNGTELQPFAEDLHYDFNFQDIRSLTEPRKLKKGDSFDVECYYDSTGRNNVTYGGISTHEEMCVSTLLFYPKQNIDGCGSYPMYEAINSTLENAIATYTAWDWSQESVRDNFKSIVKQSDYNFFCTYRQTEPHHTFYRRKMPEVNKKYVPPRDNCPVDPASVFG